MKEPPMNQYLRPSEFDPEKHVVSFNNYLVRSIAPTGTGFWRVDCGGNRIGVVKDDLCLQLVNSLEPAPPPTREQIGEEMILTLLDGMITFSRLLKACELGGEAVLIAVQDLAHQIASDKRLLTAIQMATVEAQEERGS
jgi:hypothetical protein